MTIGFSFHRLLAVLIKEFVQMRRDRLTFGIMIGIPLIQLILFGFAINANPRHLPTAVLDADNSQFSRSILRALSTSEYFDIKHSVSGEEEIEQLIKRGYYQFVVHIPGNFSRDLVRGEKPSLLLEADATDPGATSYAMFALTSLVGTVLNRDLRGPLQSLQGGSQPFEVITHRHYNPENDTQSNIVPGLMGVVLTMTLVVITSLAVARERERGTIENLLATPLCPTEIMLGKILPYVIVGYIQASLILLAARFVFKVEPVGSITLLFAVTSVFLLANLAVGVTFSTLAQNQLQAVQMSFFFFLPSILLSGFMFAFRGMPAWAQMLAEILPLTHFLRIIRGIMLKGSDFSDIAGEVGAIGLFALVMVFIAVVRFRQTLD